MGKEAFDVGKNPKGVAVANGRVYVANADSGTVSVLSEADPGAGAAGVKVGGQPRAIDVVGGRVWVTNGDTEANVAAGTENGWVDYFDERAGKREGKVHRRRLARGSRRQL